jgi:hypothetical protein
LRDCSDRSRFGMASPFSSDLLESKPRSDRFVPKCLDATASCLHVTVLGSGPPGASVDFSPRIDDFPQLR